MFNFQDPKDMLPSEAVAYIETLHEEIRQLTRVNENLGVPDCFVRDGAEDFESEQELIDSMEIGEVVEVTSVKKFGNTFKLKISKNRIDDHPSRIAAEHSKMLHNL